MATVCRLCLSESDKNTDVSDIRDGLPISVIIMIICPVKVELNDSLPKQICDECLEIVLSAYKLRDVSINTDRYFRNCGVEVQEIQELEIEDHDQQEILKLEDEESLEEDEVHEDEAATATETEEIIEEDDYDMSKDELVVYDVSDQFITLDPNFKWKIDCSPNVETKKSAVWNYFGYLQDVDDQHVASEKDYYFCKICVEQHQSLKPKYKAESIATSVLFSHLKRVHGIHKTDMIESSLPNASHQVPELVSCEICDKLFNSGSLSIHMGIEHNHERSHEKSTQYKVNCFKNSSKSLAWDYFGALENHDSESLDDYYFYCRLCVEEEGKLNPKYTKNTSTSILLLHLKNAHIPKTPEELAKRKLPEPITVSSSKRLKTDDFNCQLCGESLETRKSLNRHLAKEHNEEQPRNFMCQLEDCNKSFTMRDTLIKHMKNIHQGVKFPCDRCPTVLSTRMSLRRHIESCHLKLKSFLCDHCNVAYSEQKSLNHHIQKVHLGIVEKRIPCELCHLKFPNQWSLRRHSLTHTGEVRNTIKHTKIALHYFLPQKPHKCNFCSSSYASKGDLAKHLTKVHKDSVYKCDHPGCTEGFRLKNDLRDHYKVHYIGEDVQEEFEIEYLE